MKLSQLIKDATDLLAEFGDLDTGMLTDEGLYCGEAVAIYYDDDEGLLGDPKAMIQP